MAVTGWDRELARALWTELPYAGVEVEAVELEDGDPSPVVAAIFRASERPGCRFGIRFETRPDADMASQPPDMLAQELSVNLQELIHAVGPGLPWNCEPGEVTWLDF